MVTRVATEPDVLKWARDACGLSIDGASQKLQFTKEYLEKVESGGVDPSVSLFRKMSNVYALPEATLLSATRPTLPSLPTDYRVFEGEAPTISYETILAVRRVRSRQEDIADLAEYSDDIKAPRVRACGMLDDEDRIAERERLQLKFSRTTQRRLTSQKIFLFIRMAIEEMGISIYFENFPLDDARGISLYDNDFPAIICNQNEKFNGARSFTILHEYCHLMLRMAGLSDHNRNNSVERFCNKFAAAFLLPKDDIKAYIVEGVEPDMEALERIANKFGSTISQVALRLEDLDLVRVGYFHEVWSLIGSNIKKNRKGGPKYRYTVLANLGHNLTGIVLKSVSSGIIDKFEASRILQISPHHFGDITNAIKKRRVDFAYE